MAKSWDQVTESPAWRALDAQQQAAAKRQYFDEVVAPRLPEPKRAAAWSQFETYVPVADRERTGAEVARESAGVVGKGLSMVGKVAGDVVDQVAIQTQRAAQNLTASEDEKALQRAQATVTAGTYETPTGRSPRPEDYVERAVDAAPDLWSPAQDTALGRAVHDAPDYWEGMKSATTKAQQREVFGAADAAGGSEIIGAWETLKALKHRPLVATELIVENLGLMVPTAVSTRIAAVPAAREAFEQTFKAESQRLIAAHVPREIAEQAAQKTAIKVARNAGIRAGAAAGMWTEGAMGAAFSGDEAAQAILVMDDEVIGRSASYKDLRAQGLSDRDARLRLAQEAKLIAGPIAGASTATIGRLTGALGREAEIFGGLGMTTQSILGGLMRFGGTVGRETAQEALQEGGEQVASNVGSLTARGDDVTLAGATEGTGTAAAVGGVAGAGMGAAAGGVEAANAVGKGSPSEPDTVQDNSAGWDQQTPATGRDAQTPTSTAAADRPDPRSTDARDGETPAPAPGDDGANRQESQSLMQDDIGAAFKRIEGYENDAGETGAGGGGGDSSTQGGERAGAVSEGEPTRGQAAEAAAGGVEPVPALRREAGDSNTSLDQAAHEAATSPQNDLREPSEAQKDAGNYRKGHLRLHGLEISVENPAGSRRRPEWNPLEDHYGYIRGTKGRDKEHIDVFVGPDPASTEAFVVDQVDPRTGQFDEHKIILGARSEAEAREIYRRNYQSGWRGLGAISRTSVDDLKQWLQKPRRTPFRRGLQPSLADTRLDDDAMRKDLEAMAAGAGWALRGGEAIPGDFRPPSPGARGANLYAEEPTTLADQIRDGGIADRTSWVANEPWFAGVQRDARLPGNEDGSATREAVRKAIAGEGMTAAERRHVAAMLDTIEGELRDAEASNFEPEDFADAAAWGLDTAAEADVLDHALLARIAEADPDGFERAAVQYENDDAQLMAWAQEWADGQRPQQPESRAAPDRRGETDRGTQDEGEGTSQGGQRVEAGRRLGREEGTQGEVDAGPALELEQQTEADLAARAEQQAAAEAAGRDEDRRAADKAQADRERDDFTLTGSDRAADVAMAGGQQDLLGAATASQVDDSRDTSPVSSTSKPLTAKDEAVAVDESAGTDAKQGQPALRIEPLNSGQIIVRGDTKPNKDRIKAVGGAVWDKKEGGWRFKKDREAKVREALADLLDASDQSPITPFGSDSLGADQQGIGDVERSGRGVESDREDAEAAQRVGQEVVRDGPGRDDGRARADGQSARTAGQGSRGGAGVPGTGAVARGARSDTGVRRGEPGAQGGTAGSARDQRGVADRDRATKPDHVPSRSVEAAARRSVNLEEKVRLQREAESVPVKLGARINIADTLPFLLPSQHDDVEFAERRFTDDKAQPGVLFTNGTGTGKTYTALGIAKRFQRRGKDSILVMVPNDKIASDWISSGANLGLDIKKLESTKDNGDTGIVITTYANAGDNLTLADRDWDLIIPDEAHYLGSGKQGDLTRAGEALRAITRHHRGGHRRSAMKHRDLHDELRKLSDTLDANRKILNSPDTMDQVRDSVRKETEAAEKRSAEIRAELKTRVAADAAAAPKEPTRVAFMSASPFAYDKAVDWAEGYLFTYPEDSQNRGYNVPQGRERFMVDHFGYRMRHNRLTEPGPDVDRGLLEVEFNQWLRDQGALSTRQLDSEHDYDREFVLVDDAVGSKVDQGFEFLRNAYGGLFSPLHGLMRESFDYQAQMYLLEAIKAKHAESMIRDYLKRGRKVVVFHGFNKGGSKHPFDFGFMSSDRVLEIPIRDTGTEGDAAKRLDKAQMLKFGATEKPAQSNYDTGTIEIKLKDLIRLFESLRPDLKNLDLGEMLSPIERFTRDFPEARFVNGLVTPRKRRQAVEWFNDDATGPAVLVVQSDAGREGISMHDTTGAHRRVIVNLGLPVRPVAAIQEEGRIYRVGQASDAVMRYLNTGTAWERSAFAQKIATRAGTVENMAMGAEARALKESFIEAFEASAPYVGRDDDGKGGKARDRASRRTLTGFERAKTHYFAQLKKTSRTKAAEGIDYFATPEPVGFKMVEWAGIGAGDAVLEPSAGHGAIARYFPESAKRRLIEPSPELSSRASLVAGGAEIVASRFEEHNVVNKYDAVVMNPPFGHGGKTAMDHVAKAIEHLKDNGRVVALIPEGPAAGKQWEKLVSGHDDIHVAATISLPASTFERAGTAVKTKIVVIDRPAMSLTWDAQKRRSVYKAPELPATKRIDLSGAETIKELFERLEGVDVPRRVGAPEPTAAAAPRRAQIQAAVQNRRATIAGSLTPAAARVMAVNYLGENGIAGLERSGILRFVNDVEGLPSAALKDYVEAADERNAGTHVVAITDQATGRVFIIANRVAASDIPGLILHEIGEHYGLPRMLGESKYAALLDEVRGLRDDDAVRTAWDRVAKDRPDLDQTGNEFASEVLAQLAESEAFRQQPLWKRLLSWLRQFLFRIGFTGAWKLRAEDLTGLVVAALRRATRDGSLKATTGDDLQAATGTAPVFYSQLAEVVAEKLPKKGGAAIYKTMIAAWQRKGEFKKEELEWSGLMEWLDTQGRNLTRDDVVAYLRDNAVHIEEVESPVDRSMGSSHDFSAYQMPGGENYRELLLTLPIDSAAADAAIAGQLAELESQKSEYAAAGNDRMVRNTDIKIAMTKRTKSDQVPTFSSSHFAQPNILAHVRFNERTTDDGKRVLFVEEVQSDWHQSGRKKGYANGEDAKVNAAIKEYDALMTRMTAFGLRKLSDADRARIEELRPIVRGRGHGTGAVPDAPFKQSWPLLAMKRMLRYASEQGFDSLAWTTGAVQAARYDLSTQVSFIAAVKNDDGTYSLSAESKDGRTLDSMTVPENKLADVVGKDMAERIVKDGGGQYSGVDLQIGGEALRAFYDRELVNEVNRYAKKWDAKVRTGKVSTGMVDRGVADALLGRAERRSPELSTADAHVLEITPAMREAAMAPQPLFAVRAETRAAYAQRIDELFAGSQAQQNGVRVLDSSDVLDLLGYAGKPVHIVEGKVVAGRYNHHLDAADWKKVPDWIENPVAVFDSETETGSGRLVFVAPETKNGKPIHIIVGPDEGRAGLDVHLVINAFDKDRGVPPYRRWIDNGLLRYADQKQGPAFDRATGLHISGRLGQAQGRGQKVFSYRDLVKLRNANRFQAAVRGGPPARGPSGPQQVLPMQPQTIGLSEETMLQIAQRKLQDKFNRVWQVQDVITKAGRTIDDHKDVYTKEQLFYGRVDHLLKALESKYVQPLALAMAAEKVSIEQLDQYLYARHAPEANAYIATINPELPDGGSGMLTRDAIEFMNSLKADRRAVLDALAKRVDKMNSDKLVVLEKLGLVDRQQLALWRNKYNFYVPLKSDIDPNASGTGIGYDVRGRESKRRLGRRSAAASPLMNSIRDFQRTIIRAGKAEVGQSFLALVRAFPDVKNADGKPLWEIKQPSDFLERRLVETVTVNPITGLKTTVREVEWAHDPTFSMQDDVFGVKEGGKQIWIQVNDPVLASQLKNLGDQHLPELLRGIALGTRLLASLHTGLNPEFWVTNFSRDIQAALVHIRDLQDRGIAGDGIKRAVVRDLRPGSGLLRALVKSEKVKVAAQPKQIEWQRWAKDYELNGGKVGFFGLKSISAIADDVEKLIRIAGNDRSNMRKAWDVILDTTEAVNAAVENMMRVSVYRRLVESGVSRQKAAIAARRLTVNFNKRGEWSTYIGAFFMFFNAGVQGAARMASALKNSKSVRYIAGAFGVVGMLAALWNELIGGDDEDKDEKKHLQYSDYQKNTNLLLLGPSGNAAIKLPLSYGYNVFYVIGYRAVEAVLNPDAGLGTFLANVAGATAGAFDPIGVTEGIGQVLSGEPEAAIPTLSPSLVRPLVEAAVNRNFMGNQIHPEKFFPDDIKPDSERAWTKTPEFWKASARALNFVTGGDKHESGWISISPETMEHLWTSYIGGLGRLVVDTVELGIDAATMTRPEAVSDVPFFRKVAAEPYPGYTAGRYFEVRDVLLPKRKAADDPDTPKKRYDALQERWGDALDTMYWADGMIRDARANLKDAKSEDEREQYEAEINGYMNEVIRDYNAAAREAKR